MFSCVSILFFCWLFIVRFYAIQICNEGKASHFVDAQSKATSNWMRYVNCAMKEADKNLLAFQYKGGIYYCTLKPVSSGTYIFYN